ncbi:MAG: hypothetical protein ACPGUE_07255 [Marinomonas sp.]
MFCDFNRELQGLMIEKSDQLKKAQIKERLTTFKNGLAADRYEFFSTPFIFSQTDFEKLSSDLKHLLDAQTNIMNQIYQQRSKQEILDYFMIPNVLRAYINWQRLLSGEQTIARLDLVPHKKGYSLCGMNLHTGVGGMACGDAYDLLMESLSLEPYYDHGKVSAYLTLAEEIKTLCRQQKYERLVILDWQSHADKGYPSFELMQLSFIQAGVRLPVITHTEQSYPEAWLAPEEAKKTLVYRGFGLNEIDPYDEFLHALLESEANILHGFEDELRSNKRWLALMWDEAYQARLTLEQKQAIKQYLPYTCLLSQDTLPHFIANKNDYLFRGNGTTRGQGVLAGKAYSDAELEKKLLKIGVENVLVQEFMEADDMPILHDTDEQPAGHKFVLGLYIMGERSQGLAIRGSKVCDRINLSSGLSKTGWAAIINEQEKDQLIEAVRRL